MINNTFKNTALIISLVLISNLSYVSLNILKGKQSQIVDKNLSIEDKILQAVAIKALDIRPVIIKGCQGECVSIDMNFPHNSAFTGSYAAWTPSHGSPSVSPNNAWMWSANNIGEGINLNYSFSQGQNYCLDIDAFTNVDTNSPPNANARANINLTPNAVNGVVVTGGGTSIPALPAGSQTIWNQTYSTLPDGAVSNYLFNFTSFSNYNNIWFHPSSPALPAVHLAIKKVNICIIREDPCKFKLSAQYKSYCNRVTFYPIISVPSGSTNQVQTYLWEFGDGTTSNEANPTHFYNVGGAYTAVLTVLVINKDGKCCTKKYKFQVYVKECPPCELVKLNTIKVTNLGSFRLYEPTIPNNIYYAYKWEFSDGSTYNTRQVYKNNFILWAKLTVYFIGNEKDCCNATTIRYFFIIHPIPIDIKDFAARQASDAVINDVNESNIKLDNSQDFIFDENLTLDQIKLKLDELSDDKFTNIDGKKIEFSG